MTPLLAFLYLILLFLLGYVFVCLLQRGTGLQLSKIMFLSSGFGTGMMSFIFFWASLSGYKPDRILIGVIFACISIGIMALTRSGWIVWPLPADFGHSRESKWLIILRLLGLLFIISTLVSVSWHSLRYTLYEWDAFSIWGLKAKVLYLESLSSRPDYFFDVTLSYSHLDYPLGLPFLISGAYAIIGEANDQWGKIVLPYLSLAFFLMLYDGFRWKLKPTQSLLIAAICVGASPVIRWAGSGNADLALTFYYGVSIRYLLQWLKSKKLADVIIAAMFSAFCGFTKNEGIALAAINLLVLLFAWAKIRRKDGCIAVASFFLIQAVFILPWLLWSSEIPRTHENYLGRMNIGTFVDNLDRLGPVLHHFAHQFLRVDLWGGIWLLQIGFAVVGWRAFADSMVRWCWLLFAAHIALYVLVFIVTPWKIDNLAKSSLDRLLMHLIPVAGLISSFHWAALQNKSSHYVKNTF